MSRAVEPSPAEFNQLVALYNARRYADLESRARVVAGQYPASGFAWKLLGAAQQMQGKNALAAFQKTAELMPKDAEAHFNLGVVQKSLGLSADAAASYRRAIRLKPDYAEAHGNLGNVLYDLGQIKDAVVSYRRAVALKPNYAESHNNLGVALKDLGQFQGAEACYRRALEIRGDYVEALNNLANLLVSRGESASALNLIVRSLQLENRLETRVAFVNCVKRVKFTHVDDAVRDAVIRALSENWCRPVDLAWISADLLKLDPDTGACIARAAASWPQRLPAPELYGAGGISAVSDDTLLRRLIESTPACGIEVERFLTMARHCLLVAAGDEHASESVPENVLNLYSALAQQCFINEYIFAWTDAESAQAHQLRDSLVAALESGNQIHALWPLAVACYFPLHALPNAERLPGRAWPRALETVLQQQVREPAVERQFRAGIPRLTGIDDGVSLQVRSMYEENPYPRWIRTAPAAPARTIDEVLRQNFPLTRFKSLEAVTHPEILIAGCGTGQHSIQTAQRFRGAKLLAIDLSLSSISYAQRKSQELGLTNIEYAQADIIKLGSLGRSFDLIESAGVLHHLADPYAGWRVLLSLLRPGGVMKIALYSEAARQGIVRARAFIAEHGYGSTAGDIRQCRQQLLDSYDEATLESVFTTTDFYSTSACRDLLFHVQEHRMTIAGIAAFLREDKLQFLGFENEPGLVYAYRRRFPEDHAATSLANWQIYENENPGAFIGMYQFWIQKPD
ncbi:MAG: tetratricopeptide repeat protein [Nitrosomonadales bacterium]|nr:tetratricopeptide repeat protein [Nitrosomonadales bacterium]